MATLTKTYKNTKKLSYQLSPEMQEASTTTKKNKIKRIPIKDSVSAWKSNKLKRDANVKKHTVLKNIVNATTPKLIAESSVDVRIVSILQNIKISHKTKYEVYII